MDLLPLSEIITLVMGGGAGTRLFPLTKLRSKPAVPLAGKYRLVDIPISNSINSGMNRILVLTQFNSASLNRHVSNSYRFGRFTNGFVQIIAAEQTPESGDWFQGTADAVRQSLNHVDGLRHQYLLILSGDQLYQMNYVEMFAHHINSGAEITIATIPVTPEDATGFGILKTDETSQVVEFVEKPKGDRLADLHSEVSPEMYAQGRTLLASMGIYIFNRSVLKKELATNPSFTDFGKEVIPNAIGSRKVHSFPFTGYWSDIGTIRSFYDANLALAKRIPDFDLYSPTMPIFTNARILPPAKIQSCYVQDSLIAEGSVIINSHIANSVIGIRSFVEHNTTIKNSILMGSDFYAWHEKGLRQRGLDAPDSPGVGVESYIENAIIDKNVSIGSRCVIKNQEGVNEADGPNYYIRDGIVVIPKNTVIPPGTII